MLLDSLLYVTLYWLILGCLGGLVGVRSRSFAKVVFLLSSFGGVALLVLGWCGLSSPSQALLLPLGIGSFGLHFSLDKLSSLFVLLLAVATIGIGIFSCQYYDEESTRARRLVYFQYHLFLASMVWVLVASDVYSFMVSWELMALSSYFLVTGFKQTDETQRAGFLYLIIAHIGALAILLSFIMLLQGQHGLTFSVMQHSQLSPFYINVAFLLAFIGFGAKAGLLPLHVWLPEAHPAAPSPISALMSGVMLKMAIYGILRVSIGILGPHMMPWWGILLLAVGLVTAFYGVLFAAMQSDMKRLLAYSSIENIGIIVAGIGLAMLFDSYHLYAFAILALVASLYHAVNHALFKSLLFLSTGSVLHATGERNLGKLGGLIRKMPWVALLALIGVLAIAGLPPLNGFVSEWLFLQSLLFSPHLPTLLLNIVIPLGAAALVLVIGLAAYVMVKFFGIIFLGQPRETRLEDAKEAPFLELVGMGWLAAGCIFLGIFPIVLLPKLTSLGESLFGQVAPILRQSSALWLVPTHIARASYSPILFLLTLLLLSGIVFFVIRLVFHGRLKRGAAWDCGFPLQTPRMQDSAQGFGQPIKHMFGHFLKIHRVSPDPFSYAPKYQTKAEDRLWYACYLPIVRITFWCSKKVSRLQQGKISLYLIYSLVTLLLLLWWVY